MPKASEIVTAELMVFGPDRKGIVSGITGYLFDSNGNIEQINQNVAQGLFMMHLEAVFPRENFQKTRFEDGLRKLAQKLGMEVKLHYEKPDKKRMAILVSKQAHCLDLLLESRKRHEIRADIALVISTHDLLAKRVKRHGIPFYVVPDADPLTRESRQLDLLERHDVDFIVLARYMRILSPRFVWRYPNRIINIHPSLLPAFPGAHAYMQALERGVRVVGASAHFVTTDLDQGPIIWQESFQIASRDTLETVRTKGERLEARVLLKAVKLYLAERLQVYWGKVAIKNP